MKRLLLFLLLVLACPAFAQNQTTVTGTLTDPNGIAYYPATVLACLSPSTLNPKVGGNSINLNQGSNYCIGPVNTSSSGSFQMALYTNASITPAATTWIFTVQAAGTAPPVGKGTLSFSSAGVTISGASQDVSTNINSVGPAQLQTTSGSVTTGNLDNILFVDGTKYATCDAAVTAATTQAGAGLALVIVPSTYAGAACTTIPTNNHVQVWYLNNIDPLVQSGVFWNTTSATPVHAMLRPQMNDASPVGNSLSVYAINRVSGVIPANSAMDAISPEVQSVGTITSVGSGTVLQGSENVATLASTGGTWPDIRATVSYVRDIPSNTTNASNTSAFYIPTMTKTGTGNYGTLVGAIFNKQNAGNVANWAMQSFGSSLFSFNTSGEKLFISGDSFSNSNVIDLADTHAGGHTWDIGEMQNVAHLSFRDISQTGGPAWSFLVTGTTGVEGIFSHANTANRTYTFPDASTNMPFIIALTSQYTNSTTTFTNVSGGNTIQFAVAANQNYTATCHLYYQAAATGGLNIEFTGPASPTAVRYGMDLPTALTAVASGEADAFGSSIGAVSTNGAANLDAMVSFSLINGANAGTVNLLAKSSAAVQLQIQSGSFCQIQ